MFQRRQLHQILDTTAWSVSILWYQDIAPPGTTWARVYFQLKAFPLGTTIRSGRLRVNVSQCCRYHRLWRQPQNFIVAPRINMQMYFQCNKSKQSFSMRLYQNLVSKWEQTRVSLSHDLNHPFENVGGGGGACITYSNSFLPSTIPFVIVGGKKTTLESGSMWKYSWWYPESHYIDLG